MLLVRSSLTEILLEVTNDELRSIATDTLSKMRLKGKVVCLGDVTHSVPGKLYMANWIITTSAVLRFCLYIYI